MAFDPSRATTTFAFWSVFVLAMLTSCAAIMPQGCTKAKAYVTAMKSDLRNMHQAQEEYRGAHGRFANGAEIAGFFRSSTGGRIIVEHADKTSWSARTTHIAVQDTFCTIGSTDDQPRCTEAEDWRRPRWTRNATFNVAIDLWLFVFTIHRRRWRLETYQQRRIRITRMLRIVS